MTTSVLSATGTRLPGIVTYLDVEGLGRGAHRLTIERMGPDDEDEDAPPLRYDIAFWR